MPPPARRTDAIRELQALVDAQATVRDQQSKLAQAGVRRAFESVTDFRDPRQTRRAVTEAVKVVQAAQRRTASVTDGYLARSTSTITGRRVDTVGAVDVRSLRRKLPQDIIETLADGRQVSAAQAAAAQRRVEAVPAEQVYGRIPEHVRFATVAKGMSEDQARIDGLRRAMVVADTDVMLADRAQINRFFTERKPRGVVGYRRILHPELGSGAPPCGLCVVASDRLYQVAELMPIHARCRCSVSAATADSDPGQSLNSEDLARIYEAAGGNTRNQLKTIRVAVTEHGELGPVLTNADHNVRDLNDFARTQSRDLEKNWLAELESLQEQLDALVSRSGESQDVDEAIRWNRNKIRELSARLP
jgi:hypothetical protein